MGANFGWVFLLHFIFYLIVFALYLFRKNNKNNKYKHKNESNKS